VDDVSVLRDKRMKHMMRNFKNWHPIQLPFRNWSYCLQSKGLFPISLSLKDHIVLCFFLPFPHLLTDGLPTSHLCHCWHLLSSNFINQLSMEKGINEYQHRLRGLLLTNSTSFCVLLIYRVTLENRYNWAKSTR
jgi:hypothetical protein